MKDVLLDNPHTFKSVLTVNPNEGGEQVIIDDADRVFTCIKFTYYM